MSFFLLLVSLLVGFCDANQYCASILPTQSAGASGFVAMDIQGGSAFLSVSLDLSNYAPPMACTSTDINSKGLNYHIHSYWKNTTVVSSANFYCGASFTGAHYDPNLACGPASQSAATLCPLLNRTISKGNYKYNCDYKAGDYSSCEVGDLSGKSGSLKPTVSNGRVFMLPLFIDFQPAYDYNYKMETAASLPWYSIVFHCPNAAGTRLVCAEFSTSALDSCQPAFDTFKHCPLPTAAPTIMPTANPSFSPTTSKPSAMPSADPTAVPTLSPTRSPSSVPSAEPTVTPTSSPSTVPSADPTLSPTSTPSTVPSAKPSSTPTIPPTAIPTITKPICQFGGYCRSDGDCYAGNKCYVSSVYYSQCIANTAATYGCVSNYRTKCSSTSLCCDPGAYCDFSLKYPQCRQPTSSSGLCVDPTGF